MIPQNLPEFQGTFSSGAGQALLKIPKYALTLNQIVLKLGGTALTKAMLTRIRLKIGTKPVYEITGADLDAINKYRGIFDTAKYLTIDFNEQFAPDIVGKELGGYDMSQLSDDMYLEIDVAGATAPTLKAKAIFTPPQDNPLVLKMVPVSRYMGTVGKSTFEFDAKGALIKRAFFFYTGSDWSGVATAAAWTGNAVNTGTVGAITVSAGAKLGVHKITIAEPGSNVGTFIHEDPDGKIVSAKGVVASAYSGGGLAFTVSDGSTDFIPGEGFDITVVDRDGNLSELTVKKNGLPVWEATCQDARYLQSVYKRAPQKQLYVYEPIVDNNQSGMLTTKDAEVMEFLMTLGAADTVRAYFEVIDMPGGLSA